MCELLSGRYQQPVVRQKERAKVDSSSLRSLRSSFVGLQTCASLKPAPEADAPAQVSRPLPEED